MQWLEAVERSKDGRFLGLLVMAGVALIGCHQLLPVTPRAFIERIGKAPILLRYAFSAGLLFAAMILAARKAQPFIYFQF
jgi:hypothetical protein